MKKTIELKADSVIGEDTAVTMAFDYTPSQPAIMPPSTVCGPACPAEIEITSVLIGQDDICSDLNENCIDRLTEDCWSEVRYLEYMEKEQQYMSENRDEYA